MSKSLFSSLLLILPFLAVACTKAQPQSNIETLTKENAEEAIQTWISDTFTAVGDINAFAADMETGSVTVSNIQKQSEEKATAAIYISIPTRQISISGNGSAYFHRRADGRWILTSLRFSESSMGIFQPRYGSADDLNVEVEDVVSPKYLSQKASEAVAALLQEIRTPTLFLMFDKPSGEPFSSHLPGKLRRVVKLKAQAMALPEIIQLIDPPDANPLARQNAIKSIYYFGSPEASAAVPALTKAIRDTDSTVRRFAIATLKTLVPEPRSILPSLYEAMKDKDQGVKFDAALAMVEIGPDEGQLQDIIPILILMLSQKGNIRYDAVSSLGKIGPAAKTATANLVRLLNIKDNELRVNVARALWTIDQRNVDVITPAMIDILRNSFLGLPSRDTKYNPADHVEGALSLLGEIGPKAKSAVPAIQELVKRLRARKTSGAIDGYIAEALKKIQSTGD